MTTHRVMLAAACTLETVGVVFLTVALANVFGVLLAR